MSNEANLREFMELADAVIDGRATDEQARRLELMASGSQALMRTFADLSWLNASLIRSTEGIPVLSNLSLDGGSSRGNAGTRRWLPANRWVLSALASMIVGALTLAALNWKSAIEKSTFASLNAMDGTRWISATVPTNKGSRVGNCRLKLAAGLVTVQFDVGAVIELEGPADFEVIGPNRCQLNSGKLLATVGNDFKGFVVDTPNAILTDQGTSFCVSVQKDGESKMQVLEGRVDVEDRKTGQARTVFGNNGVKLSPGRIADSNDVEQGSAIASVSPSAGSRVVHISTSMGNGTDYWVQRDDSKPGSESVAAQPILLAKWSDANNIKYDRKVYLRFDLSTLANVPISSASLHLNATPSGLGFASLAIDTTFAVYGLTDDTLDTEPLEPTWANSPANADGGGSVDARFARLLGKFVIPQGVQDGTFSIQNGELLDFLSTDKNRIVTLLLVCETRSIAGSSLVFGFAGSHNNTLSPPTLRFEYRK